MASLISATFSPMTGKRHRVALIDLDGVLIPNCPITATKIANLVARESGLSLLEASRYNRYLYQTHGHSFIGMRKEMQWKGSFADFTSFVYGDLSEERTWFKERTEIDGTVKASLKSLQDRDDVTTYVFSNSPEVWCNFAVDMIGLNGMSFGDRLMSSDHPVFRVAWGDPLLKPEPGVYDNLTRFVEGRHGECQIDLIDDTYINLLPVVQNDRWRCLWVTPLNRKTRHSSVIAISGLKEYVELLGDDRV